MTGSTVVWIVWGVLTFALELAGLAHLNVAGVELQPLTTVVRREMGRSTMFVGAVAAFCFWLTFHFLVQTYLPKRFKGKK
jgi:hypothetical protein